VGDGGGVKSESSGAEAPFLCVVVSDLKVRPLKEKPEDWHGSGAPVGMTVSQRVMRLVEAKSERRPPEKAAATKAYPKNPHAKPACGATEQSQETDLKIGHYKKTRTR
jgi:hypothetical protein